MKHVRAKNASSADSSPVVSRSVKGARVNWGRLMKQGMMGRRKGEDRDDWSTTGRSRVEKLDN